MQNPLAAKVREADGKEKKKANKGLFFSLLFFERSILSMRNSF